MRKGFSIAGRVAYPTNIFLKIKTVFLHDAIPEMPSFSMRPAKYFYDNPLPKYLDPKTVLIYLPHPVQLYHYVSLSIVSCFVSVLQEVGEKDGEEQGAASGQDPS